MMPIPFPHSRRFARPTAIVAIIFIVVFGIELYRTGEYFAGLAFFGMAGILVLGVAVYSMEWFQNLDQSLRIFQIIIVTSVIGGAAGLFLYGMEGAVFGFTYTFLGAQLAGTVSALFLRQRDEKEEREYESEMRKYGKEP
jgi:CHASE2 domain-containing sensor protein